MSAVPGELKRELDPNTIMVATESFATELARPAGGVEVVTVIKGRTRVAASHPLVAQCPMYWEPAGDGLTYRAEETGGPRSGRQRS